jgi:tetratricopeptide (TPR) repeat protein
VRAELDAAIRVFEEIGDEAGLGRALSIGGLLRFWRGDAAGAIEEYERAARLARNAGDRPQEIQDLQFVLLAVVCGPTPVVTARERVDDIQRGVEGNSRLEVFVMRARAQLDAMQGRFDAARELFADSNALAEERGVGALSGAAGEIELLAGDAPAGAHFSNCLRGIRAARGLGPLREPGSAPHRRT